MSKDIQMFVICDHYVNGKSYINGECPRCYGTGYYFDIYFDSKGQAVLASGSIKLLQEILKIIIEEKGSNIFHPDWGCELKKRIGTKKKNSEIERFKAELAIRGALNYLKKLQLNSQYLYGNATDDEILQTIQSIKVNNDSPTGMDISVEVMSNAGEVMVYEVRI